ncbi:MAG: sigma-54-dependent Fis family transcriptional regulator [Candidatus Latescibacteria bacterium]|nr:sigma-54-dependent Fis family transcriptional regulator [Candidatus Latescibacterota bacterium]
MSDRLRILLVDDEVNMLETLGDILRSKGHAVSTATGGLEALENLRGNAPFDLIVTDLKMPGMDGMKLLERVKEEYPWTMFVMLTGYGTIKSAIDATRKGAYNYILKPFNPDEILQIVNRIVERKNLLENNIYFQEMLSKNYHFDNIVGRAPAIQAIFERIKTIAPTNASVLLTGESGTGKELLAHVIHYSSPRKNRPFIKVSCASLSDGILESELFGHEKGAFTSASTQRKGRFELADKGTLFLDQIGDIPLFTQAKLLRVLQAMEFERVGGTETIKVDVRLISASNQDLEKAIREKRFREDLFHRLNVVPIHIPPLRERKEDIPILANYFLRVFAKETHKRILGISDDALNLMLPHHWPGNVRELRNYMERAVVLSGSDIIKPADLPPELRGADEAEEFTLRLSSKSLSEAERVLIVKALKETGWNLSKSAALLRISRGTLYNKIKKYGQRSLS